MNRFGHHIDKLESVVVFLPGVESLGMVKRPLELEGGKLQLIVVLLSKKCKVCFLINSDKTQTQVLFALEVRDRFELKMENYQAIRSG